MSTEVKKESQLEIAAVSPPTVSQVGETSYNTFNALLMLRSCNSRLSRRRKPTPKANIQPLCQAQSSKQR
jgi:hypothetical protein